MTLDRSTAPAAGPIRPFKVPAVHGSALGNGLALRVVRLPSLPIVTISVVLPACEGWAGETPGIAIFARDTLDGGTRRRSGADFSEEIERLGISLDIAAGWDSTSVSVTCLADRIEEAADLLAEVVLEPTFPVVEVDRTREQLLARIAQRARTPGALAHDNATRLIFREGSTYSRPLLGSSENIEVIDSEALQAFHARAFVPKGAVFVAAGDVESEAVEALAQSRFGSWSGSADDGSDIDAAPRSTKRAVHLVHREGAVQSELRIGHPGAARGVPDYLPLVVGNSVLGGMFSSRLNLSLREEFGFTYGVRSSFAFRRGPGPWTISTAVETEVTAEAVREALRVTEGVIDEGVTESEVASARDYLAGVFPLQFETTGQIAGRIGGLFVYDLPDTWYDEYRGRIRAVDVEQANEALRRYIRPMEVQVVVVGDAAALQEPLEALALGPLTVHDPT